MFKSNLGVGQDGDATVKDSTLDRESLGHAVPHVGEHLVGAFEAEGQVDAGVERPAAPPEPGQIPVPMLLHSWARPIVGQAKDIVVAVGETIEAPVGTGTEALTQPQGLVHEITGTLLKLLLGHLLHLLRRPLWVLLLHQLLRLLSVDLHGVPVADPQWAPFLPVNDSQPTVVRAGQGHLDVLGGLMDVSLQAGILGEPPIHWHPLRCVVGEETHLVAVEEGDVLPSEGLLVIGQHIKDLQAEGDIVLGAALSGDVPDGNKGPVDEDRTGSPSMGQGRQEQQEDPAGPR